MIDIAEWAAEAVVRLNPDAQRYHESIALDRVLGVDFTPDRMVHQAWAAYRSLVLASEAWGPSVMPRLVFSLPQVTSFVLADALGDDPLHEVGEFDVPDLVVTVRTLAAFLFAPGVEEYRLRIPFEVPQLADLPPVVTSYVCYRDGRARESGEVYRAVWFDQHPWVAPGA